MPHPTLQIGVPQDAIPQPEGRGIGRGLHATRPHWITPSGEFRAPTIEVPPAPWIQPPPASWSQPSESIEEGSYWIDIPAYDLRNFPGTDTPLLQVSKSACQVTRHPFNLPRRGRKPLWRVKDGLVVWPMFEDAMVTSLNNQRALPPP